MSANSRPLLLDMRSSVDTVDELGDAVPSTLDGAEINANSVNAAEVSDGTDTRGKSVGPSYPRAIALSLDCEPASPSAIVDSIRLQIGRARRIGATWLNVRLPDDGVATGGSSNRMRGLELSYAIWKGLRFEAEEQGVRLGIEAGNGGSFLSATEAREVIDACASHAVGVCLDAAMVSGVEDLLDWITTLRFRMTCLRWSNHVATTRLDELCAALREAAYDGPVVVGAELTVRMDFAELAAGLRSS